MLTAKSPVYGEKNIDIQFRSMMLLWRPLGQLVQFVLVQHPTRGRLILLSTDLTLEPIKIIQLYGLRFKIEVSFRQALNTIGVYAYHFWMMPMMPIKKFSGSQYLHRKGAVYRDKVKKKILAYHSHIQMGLIVQGLLQYLAISCQALVWDSFGSWLRTMRTDLAPSELVVSYALRNTLIPFLLFSPNSHFFKNFLSKRIDPSRCPDLLLDQVDLAA